LHIYSTQERSIIELTQNPGLKTQRDKPFYSIQYSAFIYSFTDFL